MRPLIGIVLVLMVAEPCQAGWPRMFPDQTVTSRNGRFKFDATSFANTPEGKRRGLFTLDFAFKLTDVKSQKVVWEKPEGTVDIQPAMVVVDDAGWVAINDPRWLRLFDTKGDEWMKLALLEDAIPNDQVEKHVGSGSGGPHWDSLSRWYFVPIHDQPHFCIRAGWGLRVVIDVASKKVIKDEGIVKETLDGEESNYVKATLQQSLLNLKTAKQPKSRERLLELAITAAHIAGQRKLAGLAPQLRELEAIPKFDAFSTAALGVEKSTVGDLDMSSYSDNGARRIVQIAIRQMCEKPVGYALTTFSPARETSDEYLEEHAKACKSFMTLITKPEHRVKMASQIKQGMTAAQVMSVIGPPDSAFTAWEYDIDSDRPYTLVISWTAEGRVGETKTIRPAKWENGGRNRYDGF